ncbi:MAG: AmmeMemoRadiSam system radical SAM enzyme [Candidatus Magasanikbacteria bacterium]|nr:AmmeMemoRadiSam system radical SAM enzyme [Candidatus Magasanikbacteria bacterium]
MFKAVLREKLDGQRVRCQACAHYCVIERDNTGVCGVRYNDDGELFLAVYGRPISVHVDPIEKKPLYHFLPGTEIFSLGTVGCNFGCDFCQNWDISQFKIQNPRLPGGGAKSKIQKFGEEWMPKKIIEHCLKNKIPSIAYTYNEPTIFAEYVYDTARLAKENGLKNVMVSNGYQSKKSLNYLAPVIDAINIDLKAWDEKFYLKICRAKLSVVKENIKLWKEKGVWVEITTLLIPGRNDEEGDLRALAKFLAGVDKGMPWHLSRFFPQYKMTDGKATPLETLIKTYEIGEKVGLKYTYVGNVLETNYEHTFCSRCGEKLIERLGMGIVQNKVKDGACFKCGERVEGIWR